MPEIKREFYVDRLLSRRWNGKVKIITVIRCCGKRYLLSHLFKPQRLDLLYRRLRYFPGRKRDYQIKFF